MFREAYFIKNARLMEFLGIVNALWRRGYDRKAKLQLLRDSGVALENMEADEQHDRVVDKDEMRSMSAEMQSLVWHHVFMPATPGARNLGVAAKFQAILHQLRLEAWDWSMVAQLLRPNSAAEFSER